MNTLAQAAAMTGMARSSILRAIKRGALSGTRQDDGTWLVDGAELARAFPVNAQPRSMTLTPTRSPRSSLRLHSNSRLGARLERHA
jgi:hypothetical protein